MNKSHVKKNHEKQTREREKKIWAKTIEPSKFCFDPKRGKKKKKKK